MCCVTDLTSTSWMAMQAAWTILPPSVPADFPVHRHPVDLADYGGDGGADSQEAAHTLP